ncbi:MAG: CPBP family intramembrane metalloprotease [Sedimentisphaerales bacterium]|nr:CPBP family intramembrane metalloprotease [Sedimentisphaerales bacterium]
MASKGSNGRRRRIGSSQLLNFAKDSYLERTSRPIYAILFLLPLVIFYEIGTVLINTDTLNQSQVRVVAFVWLQELFRYLGFQEQVVWIIPPLVVVMVLLGLQIASNKPWAIYPADLIPMAGECILLAAPLVVLSLLLNTQPPTQNQSATHIPVSLAMASATTPSSLLASIVTGIGAGIYEELVFRLILICLLVIIFQDLLRAPYTNALVMAIVISAALFSAHHHILFVGGRLGVGLPFTWAEFGFRTIAGVYFAILFAIRGFGITAGTHAFYDIIATILNWFFYNG